MGSILLSVHRSDSVRLNLTSLNTLAARDSLLSLFSHACLNKSVQTVCNLSSSHIVTLDSRSNLCDSLILASESILNCDSELISLSLLVCIVCFLIKELGEICVLSYGLLCIALCKLCSLLCSLFLCSAILLFLDVCITVSNKSFLLLCLGCLLISYRVILC